MTAKSTRPTPTLSVAVAVNVFVLPNASPLMGAVSVTLGGVESGKVVADAELLKPEIFWAASCAAIWY